MPKFTLTVTLENDKELLDLVNKIGASAVAPLLPQAATATKSKQDRSTDQQRMVAAQQAKEAKEEKKAVSKEPEEISEASYDDVKAAILKLSKDKGRDAAVAVLDKFGYTKVNSEIKEEDYLPIVQEAAAALRAE